MIRIIAVLMLVIPGIIAAYGIKLMRDSLFNELTGIFLHTGLQFFIGFIFFAAGLAFIGGFIVHRDRKRQAERKNNRSRR
ncbi:DUF2627 family protein [Virgibacillus dakarensis]|uniref:DUF2627 domain-containing protein n=1 Tax=Lentibacillus populi TaxID=1827502 RepID=A0A9W5TVW3_9BACI|nr:DUF2627 domain-containing protein [Lentibacillus populi]MBT2214403.1 DUF2627 domain-containing protein [Virgibacillus dakarensis]MTW85081.1 DUF2627 family protein [Virgibacillus dakarensis]GGB34580.1 hypothetical protein GCM10011409_10070 [Lentibacillus populi]